MGRLYRRVAHSCSACSAGGGLGVGVRPGTLLTGAACGLHHCLHHFHLAAVAQAVEAVGDDALARLQAADDLREVVKRHSGFHHPHVHFVVRPDDIHISAGRANRHGGGGHHDRVRDGAHQQPHVDELVGEQGQLRVGELGAQIEGARRAVDLVVGRDQLAGFEQLGVAGIPGLRLQLLARHELAHHLANLLLRQSEGHVHRLHLRDGGNRRGRIGAAAGVAAHGARSRHHIAGVHRAQAGEAADRGGDARPAQLQFGVVERGLVGVERGFDLGHGGALVADLLRRNRILLEQGFIAQ